MYLYIVACYPGQFGDDCQYNCSSCRHGSVCDENSRNCLCTPGWDGVICNEPCAQVTTNQYKWILYVPNVSQGGGGDNIILIYLVRQISLRHMCLKGSCTFTSLTHWESEIWTLKIHSSKNKAHQFLHIPSKWHPNPKTTYLNDIRKANLFIQKFFNKIGLDCFAGLLWGGL